MDLPVDYEAISQPERRAVREEYIRRQDGKCAYCEEPLSGGPPERVKENRINWRLFPKHFLRHPVHLHHDHETGMTKGAVHSYCNAVLWQYHGE